MESPVVRCSPLVAEAQRNAVLGCVGGRFPALAFEAEGKQRRDLEIAAQPVLPLVVAGQ